MQELVVEHLADGAVVRAAQLVLSVGVVQDGSADSSEVDAVAHTVSLDRRAAAVYAAAGAGHDLDEEIVLLSALDHLHDLAGVAEAAGDTDVNFLSGDAVGSFLDAGHAADIHEVDLLVGSVEHMGRGAERRLHDTAGSAKDLARAGGDSEGIVKFLSGKTVKGDARFLDHKGELSGREGHIHIRNIIDGELGAPGLEFFRRAGDHADHVEILGIDVVFLAVITLEDRSEHTLRRFAGGDVGQQFRIIVLHEPDPGRAAGGEHGERRLVHPVGGETLDELVCLLHDGEVRCDVHVEDLYVAQHADSLDHLALHVCSRRIAEALAQGRRDGRRREEDDLFAGIVDGFPDILCVVFGIQRADGTYDDTLAAAHALGGSQALIEGGAYTDIKAAADLADRADLLNGVAGSNAAQALDALVVVTDDAVRGIVDRIIGILSLEVVFVSAIFKAQSLQLAGITASAGEAFSPVCGNEEFEGSPSGIADHRRVCQDLQAFLHRVCAGCRQAFPAFDLNDADTAGADAVDILQITERRDIDVCIPGGLQDAGAFRNSDRNIVDFEIDHFFHVLIPPYSIKTAPNLQFCMQRPHLMQVLTSMW